MGGTGDNAEHHAVGSPVRADVGRYEPGSPDAVHELEAVLAIGLALAGKFDHDRVLGAALGTVADVIGAEGSSILLINPESGGMSFHVAGGPGAARSLLFLR